MLKGYTDTKKFSLINCLVSTSNKLLLVSTNNENSNKLLDILIVKDEFQTNRIIRRINEHVYDKCPPMRPTLGGKKQRIH